jgi:hypothetical protein
MPLVLLIALPLLAATALAGWLLAGRASSPNRAAHGAPAAQAMPTNPAIEARWGVRISQIAVTAAGGLVDLRYTVLDPDKAHAMLETLDTTPKIEVPGKAVTLALESPVHHQNGIDAGRTYFMLMVNKKGALNPGDTATVAIGDMRLENIPVR